MAAVDAAVLLEGLNNMLTSVMSMLLISRAMSNLTGTGNPTDERVGRTLRYIDPELYKTIAEGNVKRGLKLALAQTTAASLKVQLQQERGKELTEEALRRSQQPWISGMPQYTVPTEVCAAIEENLPNAAATYVQNAVTTAFIYNWSMALSGLRDPSITAVAGDCARIAMAMVAGRLLYKWFVETINACNITVTYTQPEIAGFIIGSTFEALDINENVINGCRTEFSKLYRPTLGTA